jgi:hypothetical protein
MSRIYFVAPTYVPVGGVLKIFDYVNHALALGHEPVVICEERFDDGLPLFQIERFSGLTPRNGVRYVEGYRFTVEREDFVFFSWPTQYEQIFARLMPGPPLERVIHIVQNIRHANPRWLDGCGTRMLSRPMSRIMVTEEVLTACRPYLNESSFTRVIVEGHAWEYFHRERYGGLPSPVKVGYATWKSDVGVRVEQELAGDDAFVFDSIRETVSWAKLRDLYHWADVFLGTPGAEEGFFLVGLEVLAAGAILITADAVGNRVYSRFGENCIQVELDSAPDYVEALERLADSSASEIEAIRKAGYAVLANHTLEAEREGFAEFLETLKARPLRPGVRKRVKRNPGRADGGAEQTRGPALRSRRLAFERPAPPVFDLSAEQRRLVPSFLGIGAQKAGTTWLHRNLLCHPEIGFGERKEIHFLDFEDNFERGVDWYLAQFEGNEGLICGDITPDYMIVDRSRVEWIHALNPGMRLVLLLRNPVDRAWSAARYYLVNRDIDPSSQRPEEIQELVTRSFMLWRGGYMEAIERWETVFSQEQLFVGFFEEMVDEPELLLRRVLRHIGADPDVDVAGYPLAERFNPSPESALSDENRAFLREIFADEIAMLARRFGAPARDW